MHFPTYNRGLVYHKVSDRLEWGLTTTTLKQFQAQVDELNRLGFSFSTISERESSENPVLITFDDAYESVYEHAYPILEQGKGVATVFPITDYVGRKNDWDYFPEEKQVNHMDWSQLREVQSKGWEIGSHGRSHRRLITLSKDEIWDELTISKQEIEDRIGAEVTSFCPPFNVWNKELLSMIEDAGYTSLSISYPLSGLPAWGGAFIPRMGVYLQDNLTLFRAKLQASPWAPLAVMQQQLINIAGNGNLLENWGRSRGK